MGLFGPSDEKPLTRLLPERSYLYYKYPQKNSEYSVEFYLPIFENIEISESQRPNLGTYDLLGRSGNLFSYHGAKSRDFNIRFHITLPHVVEYISNYGMSEQFTDSFRYFSSERDYNKRMFFVSQVKAKDQGRAHQSSLFNGATDIQHGVGFKNVYYDQSLARYSSLLPEKNEVETLLEDLNNFTRNTFRIPVIENISQILNIFKKERPKVLKNAISYFMLLINVIRTSTLNNAKNTTLGPPTIYLNHGNMYNNIPCICTNFSIRLVSENGYDLKTMTPRRVEVNLNLSENRTGNFGAFVPFGRININSENLAGWEAIMEYRTLDPWNSTFGQYDSDLKNVEAWEAQQKAANEAGLAAQKENQSRAEDRNTQIRDIKDQEEGARIERRDQERRRIESEAADSTTYPVEIGNKEAIVTIDPIDQPGPTVGQTFDPNAGGAYKGDDGLYYPLPDPPRGGSSEPRYIDDVPGLTIDRSAGQFYINDQGQQVPLNSSPDFGGSVNEAFETASRSQAQYSNNLTSEQRSTGQGEIRAFDIVDQGQSYGRGLNLPPLQSLEPVISQPQPPIQSGIPFEPITPVLPLPLNINEVPGRGGN